MRLVQTLQPGLHVERLVRASMIVKRIRSPTTRLACWMVAKRCRCAHCSLSVRITRSSARARWCWTSFKARPPSPRRAANTTRRLQRSNSGSTMASGHGECLAGQSPGRARAVRASVQGPSRGVWRGDAELAVQRLMSSSIFMLIVNYLDHDVSRFSLGQYKRAFARLGQKSDAQQRLCDGQGVCGIVNVQADSGRVHRDDASHRRHCLARHLQRATVEGQPADRSPRLSSFETESVPRVMVVPPE